MWISHPPGAPRYIVTPRHGKKRLQRDRVEQEYSWGDSGGFSGEKICGMFVATRAVFAGGVVPELVGGDLGEEVGFGGKDLGIEEFGFNGIVDAFDIGVGVGTSGWIEAMLGAEGLLDGEMKAFGPVVDGIAVEFRAQVGGEDDLAGIDPMGLEMFEETCDAQGGIGFGECVAVGQELGAAGKLANRVLKAGQAVALHLGPVEGDIGKVFHIHLEAGEGGISGFDGPEVIFTAVAALGRSGQVVGVNDALGGVMAQWQVKFLDEAASAKAW